MVPLAAPVTSPVVPSGKVAVTLSWAVAPAAPSVLAGALTASDTGIGVTAPSTISASKPLAMPAWITNRPDWPLRVTPPSTQVARARTAPKLAGTLSMCQEPSGCTCAVRLRIEIVQFSSRRSS